MEKPGNNDEQRKNSMAQQARNFIHDPRAVDMPSADLEIRNGTLICATQDLPEIETKKDDVFPIIFDGTYVRGGHFNGPTWSVSRITDEIRNKGWWKIIGQLDEYATSDSKS